MAVVRIADLTDVFVLHFETENRRINAYTLASTLVELADAAKAANAVINPGFDIEVVVEALGPGSFRAQLKAVYSATRNLWSADTLRTIVLGVIVNFIYERTFAVKAPVTVEIRTDEVIVERGSDRLVVPRVVYDATRKAEQQPQFVRSVGRGLAAIGADERISGIGFVDNMASASPELVIPQSAIQAAAVSQTEPPSSRVIEETCELQIVKAILDRTKRKWEFIWHGIRISAPVLDAMFYNDFFAHRITIAPGDTLKVRLAVRQCLDPNVGMYTNTGYEVLEVLEHVPQLRQVPLTDHPD